MTGIELSSVSCVTKAAFNPASLNGTYQVLNGSGLSDDVKIFKLYNGSTTVSIDISYDGVTDHDFIPPLGTLIVDFQANHSDSPIGGTKYMRRGQLIWGKTAEAPTYLQMIGYR